MKQLKRLVAFAMALLLVPAGGFASSHREAPITALDHSADVTDWYAFVSYDHPDRVTMIVPNENPVHPAADVIPQGATAKFKPFKQFADLLECSKGNSQMHPCKRSVLGRPMSEPSKGRA